MRIKSLGSGNWEVLSYQKKDGKAVVETLVDLSTYALKSDIQKFISDGTWTKPTGAKSVLVQMW